MPLRDPSEVGVRDIRRFAALQITDDQDEPRRISRSPRPPESRSQQAPLPARQADADQEQEAVDFAESVQPPTAKDERPLLADELQVHLQADVPEVVLQRVKLVSFELAEDRAHLRRHQTIVGALAWAYVDHTDQRKLDELADLVDAYRGGPWHGLPELRRLSARMPVSLKRRVEGAVLALARTHRDVSARSLMSALVWRFVVSRDDDPAAFGRLVDVLGGYHQEMARRSLRAPVASIARTL